MVKKIAVFVPVAYRGGTLRMAKNLARGLKLGAAAQEVDLDVVFGCVSNYYDIANDFAELAAMNIEIRETNWEIVAREVVAAISSGPMVCQPNFKYDHYSLPVDGKANFLDCDFWLIISDRLIRPVAPLKKYGVVVFDYIQRYVPELFTGVLRDFERDGFFPLVREAECVMCTTPSTLRDAVEYAGVPELKTRLLPFVFDPDPLLQVGENLNPNTHNYLLWVTNQSVHKNHTRVFQALANYYQHYNGKLDTVVIGMSEAFAWGDEESDRQLKAIPHLKACLNVLHSNPVLKKKVHFMGNVSEIEYANLLQSACFLLHPNLADNGTFCVLEAAYMGKPSLSARYAQMEYINSLGNLNMRFCDPYDARDMAAQLSQMEKQYRDIPLPSRAELNALHWRCKAGYFFELIRKLID